ncbi:hypothetical protein ACO0QE_004200 [Hanseniaspora vineae]
MLFPSNSHQKDKAKRSLRNNMSAAPDPSSSPSALYTQEPEEQASRAQSSESRPQRIQKLSFEQISEFVGSNANLMQDPVKFGEQNNLLQQPLFVTPSVNKTGITAETVLGEDDESVKRTIEFDLPKNRIGDETEKPRITQGQDPTPLSKFLRHPSHLVSKHYEKKGSFERKQPDLTDSMCFNEKRKQENSPKSNNANRAAGSYSGKDRFQSVYSSNPNNKSASHENDSRKSGITEKSSSSGSSSDASENGPLRECENKFEYLYLLITNELQQGNYDTAEFISEMLLTESINLIDSVSYPDQTISRVNTVVHRNLQLNTAYRGIYTYCHTLLLNRKYSTVVEVSRKYLDLKFSSPLSSPLFYLNGLSFMHAKSCLVLERNLRQGIKDLVDMEKLVWGNAEFVVDAQDANCIGYPSIATISCLLGKMFKKLDLIKQSAYYHCKALESNPNIWESVKDLSDMGVEFNLTNVFKDKLPKRLNNDGCDEKPDELNQMEDSRAYNGQTTLSNLLNKKRPSDLNSDANSNFKKGKLKDFPKTDEPKNIGKNLPFVGNSPSSGKIKTSNLPNTPPKKLFSDELPLSESIYTSPLLESNKSPRMFDAATNLNPAVTVNAKYEKEAIKNGGFTGQTLRIKKNGAAGKIHPNTLMQFSNFYGKNIAHMFKNEYCDNIMYLLFKSYKSGSNYNIYKAIRLLNSGDNAHNNSDVIPVFYTKYMPWCLKKLAVYQYENSDYKMSLKYFEQLRSFQKTSLETMDVYSTLLWHMKDKTQLSILSHELLSLEPLSHITWCCIGNLFSVMDNREDAIKSFQKSISLNKNFEYGFTLLGHEYMSLESYDLAKKCYKKAISLNPLHYNAYYGLGMCVFKIGEYEESLFYFNKAQSINRGNVVLITCCGLALEKLGYQEEALKYYDIATVLKPDSTLALFKKCYLLMELKFYTLALEGFEHLKNMQPNEPTVHFLLGKLYKIVGKEKKAFLEFTIAMNLDPKGSQLVKEAMESA